MILAKQQAKCKSLLLGEKEYYHANYFVRSFP
jgi:hypothetical protein